MLTLRSILRKTALPLLGLIAVCEVIDTSLSGFNIISHMWLIMLAMTFIIFAFESLHENLGDNALLALMATAILLTVGGFKDVLVSEQPMLNSWVFFLTLWLVLFWLKELKKQKV